MHAFTNNEEELNQLRDQLARSESESEREALRGELRIVRTERDLLKERLNAFMRRLFAAKSEARGSEQKDLLFNEIEALAPAPVPAEVAAEDTVEVPAHRTRAAATDPHGPAHRVGACLGNHGQVPGCAAAVPAGGAARALRRRSVAQLRISVIVNSDFG